jgi:multiple sugar transport system ATP-binding protein
VYVTHDQVEAMTLADRIVVLRDGQVQQVAAPLELYNRPANRFVAGFVGSPAMNFWLARLEGAGGGAGAAVTLGGKRAAISGAVPRDLAALAGRELILGVRPEDLHLPSDGGPSALWALVESAVDVVEPLGAETLLHFRVGEAKSVVRAAAATSIRPGAPLRLHADLGRAHFFDPQTGATLVSWPGA